MICILKLLKPQRLNKLTGVPHPHNRAASGQNVLQQLVGARVSEGSRGRFGTPGNNYHLSVFDNEITNLGQGQVGAEGDAPFAI